MAGWISSGPAGKIKRRFSPGEKIANNRERRIDVLPAMKRSHEISADIDRPGIRWMRVVLLLTGMAALAGCAGPSYRGYKYKPYTVRGQTYYPMSPQEAIGFTEYGVASHYKEGNWIFPGRTAIGEKLYPSTHAAAHKTLPLPCRIRVTNLKNGKSMVMRVNDRGPFIDGRILDVTAPAAKRLGFYKQGLTRVKIQVIDVGDGRYRIRRR